MGTVSRVIGDDDGGDGEQYIWSVEKLFEIAKNKPVVLIDIDAFFDVLNEPLWRDEETMREVTPMQVLINHNESFGHWKRILNADLDYPIIVIVKEDGTFDVVDGLHRLAKMYAGRSILNKNDPSRTIVKIKCVILTYKEMEPARIGEIIHISSAVAVGSEKNN